MAGYAVTDVRGRFGNADGSWGTGANDLGVILHYAGLDVDPDWWNAPLAYIKHIANLHSQRGRFATGWTFAGAGAYHEYCFGNTVYRAMNWRAWTPHCGNLAYNKRSIAIHVPIGLNQLPKDVAHGTMLTALRRADDHLQAMGLGRQSLKGHREVGSSLCPGEPIMESIRNYRQGADVQPPKADKPPVQSAPSDTVYKVLVGAFSQRSYADATASQLKAKGFGSYVYQSGSYHRVQAAALSDPVAADELVIKLKAAGWKDAYALAEKK